MIAECAPNNKRYEYLDYAKCVGILLIMFGHVTQYFSPMWGLNGYVNSFHVPIFFVVSGCLAWHKKDKQIVLSTYIKKRAIALLVPYVIFSIINSALKIGVLLIKGGITQSVLMDEAEALFITGNGTVWFLVTLFAILVIYAALTQIGGVLMRNILILLGVLGLIIPYLFTWEANPFGVVIVRIIAGFSFFAIGYFIAKLLIESKARTLTLFGMVAMIVGVISYVLFGNGYSFFGGDFSNMPVSILNGITGSIGVVVLCRAMEKRHLLGRVKEAVNYIGKNSLIIMLVHPTILLVFTYPFGGFMSGCTGAKGVIVSLGLFIVLVIAEIPFIWLINNHLPWMIGKKKNGSAIING